MPITVPVKGHNVRSALRKLKRKLEDEGTPDDLARHRYAMSRGQRRRKERREQTRRAQQP